MSVLTEDPTTLLQAVKQIRRLLSQSRNGSCALLAEDGQYVDDVIQTGVVSSFVKFLGYSHMPKLQFEAVWALTNIASGTSEQVRGLITLFGNGSKPMRVYYLIHRHRLWSMQGV